MYVGRGKIIINVHICLNLSSIGISVQGYIFSILIPPGGGKNGPGKKMMKYQAEEKGKRKKEEKGREKGRKKEKRRRKRRKKEKKKEEKEWKEIRNKGGGKRRERDWGRRG